MNDPAFLFYPGDYLRDTQTLSANAQVAYDRIMCEHMRDICEDMSKIGISQAQLKFFTRKLNEEEIEELMFTLTLVSDLYQIKWVASSISKRKIYADSRRKNRMGKAKKDMKTYDPHMENEIENEIEYKSDKESKVNTSDDFKNFMIDLNKVIAAIPKDDAEESRSFHVAALHGLTNLGYSCKYEHPIPNGRIDIVVELNTGEKVAIELDNRSPRAKNLTKLEGMGYLVVSVLRNPLKGKTYENFNLDGLVLYPFSVEPEIVYPFSSDAFFKVWETWLEYKKTEHKFTYKSKSTLQAQLLELSNLSEGNEEIAIAIIRKSIANGWKGLFKLKNENYDNTNNSNGTGWNSQAGRQDRVNSRLEDLRLLAEQRARRNGNSSAFN